MALNDEDISKVGYKARIEWYKKRVFDISDSNVTLDDFLKEKNPDIEEIRHTPEEIIGILNDLASKASKLEDKIAFMSKNLTIPVDSAKQPEVSKSVNSLDPKSKGEYISYDLYDSLLRSYETANNNVDLNYLVGSTTGDISADSVAIQDRIFQGYADMQQKDNTLGRYANSWLNGIFSWNESDYKTRQILNFADNYLDINPDPAYVPWHLRRDVGEESIDVKNLSGLWQHFSADYSKRVDLFVDGITGAATLRPDPKIEGLTTRYIKYCNDFLERANQAFDIDWAADLVCCFMQWGIRLDTKTLKGLRAILQLLQTGLTIDFADVINGIKDVINNIFRGLLCHQLIGLIRQIKQAICDPLILWINNPQQDIWRKIFACTPIDELINRYIIEAISYLERLLDSLIQNWYKQIELKNIKNNVKLDLMTEQKWAGELAKLLDTIIAVTEMAAKCGVSYSPNNELPSQIVSNYNLDQNQDKYVFPDDPNPTIYNSFIANTPQPKDVQTASPTRATQQDAGAIGGRVSSNVPGSLSDCLKKIPVDDVVGVPEWDNKSQGRP